MAFPLPHKYRQLRTFTLVHTDGRSQRTSLRACPSVWTEASGRLDRMWRRKGESRGKVSDMWKVKWDRMITFCVSEDRRADYEARREISVFYPNSFCWALSTFYSPLWSNCCIQQTFNNQTRFYLKDNRCLYVQFLNLYSQLRLPLGISLFANNIFLCIRHFYLFMCFWIYCSCIYIFFLNFQHAPEGLCWHCIIVISKVKTVHFYFILLTFADECMLSAGNVYTQMV